MQRHPDRFACGNHPPPQNTHRPHEGEERFGLDCWCGEPYLMTAAHWHDEIELNLVERGAITYQAGGSVTTLTRGQLAVFWGAMPHRVTEAQEGTRLAWLTLPLTSFLGWDLPANLRALVLHGHFVRGSGRTLGADAARFRRWTRDLAGGGEGSRVVLLEVEAHLRRLAGTPEGRRTVSPGDGAGLGHAERMCAYIAEHYAEPISVSDIAAAMGLNPTYAMGLFRAAFGRTILSYLTQYRVAHAQRLLATTDQSILDVASECGFGSVSRFYEAFGASCGLSPRAYRLSMRETRPGPLPKT